MDTMETKQEPVASWAIDRSTGIIRDASTVPVDAKTELPVGKRPKANCKQCHGRGFIGKVSASDKNHTKLAGHVVLCTCTVEKQKPKANW